MQTLSNEFTEKATRVMQADALQKEPGPEQYDGCIANSSQVYSSHIQAVETSGLQICICL